MENVSMWFTNSERAPRTVARSAARSRLGPLKYVYVCTHVIPHNLCAIQVSKGQYESRYIRHREHSSKQQRSQCRIETGQCRHGREGHDGPKKKKVRKEPWAKRGPRTNRRRNVGNSILIQWNSKWLVERTVR